MTIRLADGKILAEVDAGVGLITFNNPDRRNAVSLAMWQGLAAILDKFEKDNDVRVVILTGHGRAFVSGADTAEFDRNPDAAQHEYDRRTSASRSRLANFPKPVIARIRGHCIGAGVGIALQADIRIAASDSEYAVPAAKYGIAYGFDMVRKLTALVGPSHARMLLLTGNRIDSEEAGRMHLVDRVVPDEDLNETVLALARTIADNAPLSLRAAKLAVNEAIKSENERDAAAVHAAVAACFDSDDYREGRVAFQQNRRARFIGI